MDNVKSKPLGKQPALWKQAFSSSPYRGWNFFTILLYPIIYLLYKHKKKPSLLLDHFIVGSNPIINLILLSKLSTHNNKKTLKIGIHMPIECDYWSYELIENPIIFNLLERITGIKSDNITDFINLFFIQLSKRNIELFLIDNESSISFIKKDDFINGWILHLITKEDTRPTVSDFIEKQNIIKEKIINSFMSLIFSHTNIKKVEWVNKSYQNYPVILTKNISVSSLPQGWVDSKVNSTKDISYFTNILSDYSYGSAKFIVTNPALFSNFCLNQLKDF